MRMNNKHQSQPRPGGTEQAESREAKAGGQGTQGFQLQFITHNLRGRDTGPQKTSPERREGGGSPSLPIPQATFPTRFAMKCAVIWVICKHVSVFVFVFLNINSMNSFLNIAFLIQSILEKVQHLLTIPFPLYSIVQIFYNLCPHFPINRHAVFPHPLL